MIKIDSEKCIGCLNCISVCPFNVLEAEAGRPKVAKEFCIKCLHCAAACPECAISLNGREGVISQEIPKMPENIHKLIEGSLMTRRSYRRFKPEPVPQEIISDALRTAAWAPSAKNQHPTKWIVVNSEAMIRKMMEHILKYVKETGVSPEIAEIYEQGRNVVMGNARTLIIAYARTDAINPFVDSALALYSAELVLQSQGIGTCWAGYLMRMCNQIPAIREMLNIPEGRQVCCCLMAGYPDNEEYIHIPNRLKQPEIKWF